MNNVSKLLAIIVISYVVVRLFLFISVTVQVNGRHEPVLRDGETYLLCKFCKDYEIGDFIVFYDDLPSKYLIEEVLEVKANSVVTTLPDGRQKTVSISSIRGRLFR